MNSGLFLVFCVLLITACRKKAWDEYYGRPENLEPPIYSLLEERGNFKHLLAAIDKAGYKTTLATAGFWTLMAPHDSAFEVYFRELGISGIAGLDSTQCQKIVTYSLIYNGFKKDRVDDFQSNAGWVPNSAFRRRTAAYTGVYDAVNSAGLPIKAISSNRNNNGTVFFVEADNNSKHLPIFTDTFFRAKALPSSDYTYFYPGSSFSGFNVQDALVVEKDIPSENGVIHVINKVLVPLPSIDEFLRDKPQYSEFKKLLDRFLVEHVLNPIVSRRFSVQSGLQQNVFTKVYNANLAYSLNNENFLKLQDNDAQANCYSAFIPENNALTNYINSVLLQHYTSLEQMPVGILYDFINAHLWQTAVWPSQFNNSFNFLGEPARFNPQSDILEKRILSNGFFYGTNKVQESNLFASVFGKVYLNPAYSYMNRLLSQELKFIVSNPNQRYLLFMVSNQAWNEAGFFEDATVDNNPAFQWRFVPPSGGATVTGSSALVRMIRLINQHVVPDPSTAISTLNGQGVARTFGNEFIKWDQNKIFASGNLDSNYAAIALEFGQANNGTVVYIDKLLTFTELNPGRHLQRLGTDASSPFHLFWEYLRRSPLFNAGTGEIAGIAAGTFYTMVIPRNEAILEAVRDGFLPGTVAGNVVTPLFNPTNPLQIEQVSRFIQYHILNRVAIGSDGNESGAYETFLRNRNGDPTSVFVNNTVVNGTTFSDMESRVSNIILPQSNYISNRTMIHLLDNYMRYTF